MLFFDFFILVITIIFNISCHNFISEKRNENQFIKRNYYKKNEDIASIPSILISNNFGEEEEEYECFGSCYCDDDDDDRKTTIGNIISKRGTLSYILVSSISTIIAYKKSKTYFDSKCVKELSKECQTSSIKSSVEKCSKILRKKKENYSDEQYFEDRKNDEKRIYFCCGNCIVNKKLRAESTRKQFEHMNCEKMKQEGEVIVYESDIIQRANHPSRNFRKTARSRFCEYFLVDFCKENSKMEFTYKVNNGKLYPRKEKRIGHGCISRGRKSGLENVRCRQIEPQPTNPNWKWRLDNWNRKKEEWDLN